VFAPALGGFVYERMGADALWWSCAVLGSIGALLFATEAARARCSAAA
jgi:predicted MFS family arabinose efflux permease